MANTKKDRHLSAWILWPLGLIGLPFGHWCLLAQVDPFFSAVYSFLWWPVIFAADFAVYRLRGNSLLHDRPREFLLLALWSTPVWLFFEAFNLRLANWHYVQVPFILSWEGVFLLFSFATVLPGVFEMMELFVGIIERLTKGRGLCAKPFRVVRWKHVYFQMAIGVAMLILPLVWPDTFLCLTWGFAFFLLDPICYLCGGRSILGQIAHGDQTRFAALLLAGVATGGLWEGWNIAARSKWIYTVPFLDELKLGEMPVLGFMGFPPFVLECYAIVNGISLFRGGRNWELPSPENARLKGMTRRRAVCSWGVTIALSAITVLGILQMTMSSLDLPLDRVFRTELGPEGAASLRREGLRHTHQFRKNWDRESSPPLDIEPELLKRLCALSVMADLKGMGLEYAIRLEELGIRTPEELARWNEFALARRLTRATGRRLRIYESRFKVWILEARKRSE